MKTKKIVIAVLTAALAAAFIIGCAAPMDGASGVMGPQSAPAAGKTRVRLNVMNSNARTVMPVTGDLPDDLDDFDYFTLQIYDEDEQETVTLPVISGVDYNDPFEEADIAGFEVDLYTGIPYTFTFIGYDEDPSYPGDLNHLIAKAACETEVTLTGVTAVNLILKEITDGTGFGTFKWDVSATTFVYDSALLTLTNLKTPTAKPIEDLDLLVTPIGSDAAIPSGYYRMVITLVKAGYETHYVQEIVHIYAGGFESFYYNFTDNLPIVLPALRSNRHTITYNYGTDNGAADMSGARPLTQTNIPHGSVISVVNTNGLPPHSSSDPGPATFIFRNWCTSLNPNVVVLNPAALMIKPITLYANWKSVDEIKIGFNPSVAFTPGFVPDITTVATSFNQSASSFSILVTLNNPGSYNTFVWKDDTGTQLPNSNNLSSFTFEYDLEDAVKWWQAGDHTIYLEVSSTTNPLQVYSGSFIISVDE